MKVVINPGHGPKNAGYDPGAIGPSGLQEATETKEVGAKVEAKMRFNGIDAPLVQDGDLADITAFANAQKADYFISIHCNSATDPSAHGSETYALPGGKGETLAKLIQTEVVNALGTTNRGVKTNQNYYVLVHTDMPAILVEIAFISNPAEEKAMNDPNWDDKVASAITRGFCRFIGIDYKEPSTPVPTPQPTPTPTKEMHRVIIDDKQIMALSVEANAEAEVKRRIDTGEGTVGKVQNSITLAIEFTYTKPAPTPVDYEQEDIKVIVGGQQVNLMKGITAATKYAKLNLQGKTVLFTCVKDGTNWHLVVPVYTALVGKSEAKPQQLEALIHGANRNPNAPNLANIYFQMESIYGIRADVAFCQMVKETRSLLFGGDVKPEQHNPAGLGAVGGGTEGASFDSWEQGIEAQFQHLFAYATTADLPVGRTQYDQRLKYVLRGLSQYVDWLGAEDNPNNLGLPVEQRKGWAIPGKGYGSEILALVEEAKKIPYEEPAPDPKPDPKPNPDQPDYSGIGKVIWGIWLVIKKLLKLE